MANSLPLSIIADVTVVTSSPQVAAPTFNQGCIIGPTAAIPSYGTNARTRQYLQATYSTAMLNDGFTDESPEFIAAGLYFGQSPAPQSLIVGRQDLTAIATAVPHTGSIGTGYVVGDIVGVTQAGASNGTLRVSTIGTGGSVIGLTTVVGQQGTGYSAGTALATTGGSGTGLEVDITAIGESALQAFQACRNSNAEWYIGMVTDATDADHEAISAWVLSQVGTIYFGTTSNPDIANAVANNPAQIMFNNGSRRTWIRYATTQNAVYPAQAYAVAMEMGALLAANTQLAGSAYTAKFSAGVALLGGPTEPVGAGGLSTTQISNIEIVGVNLFVNYGGSYNVLEQGTMMAPDVYFDQVLNLDVLAANIQYAIMNLLTSVPKVPQTDAGQQQLIQAVESALDQAVLTGYIGTGTWNGQPILNLKKGTPLPTGYFVQSPKYSTISQADITARKAPPIYVALIEAGAVHFVTVAVQVQV